MFFSGINADWFIKLNLPAQSHIRLSFTPLRFSLIENSKSLRFTGRNVKIFSMTMSILALNIVLNAEKYSPIASNSSKFFTANDVVTQRFSGCVALNNIFGCVCVMQEKRIKFII